MRQFHTCGALVATTRNLWRHIIQATNPRQQSICWHSRYSNDTLNVFIGLRGTELVRGSGKPSRATHFPPAHKPFG
eukprot:scaffold557504_cov20-Prasinocladus_malaysianus.AAC.1